MASRFVSLVPPKIASVSALSASKSATRMNTVVEFYSKLPKGSSAKSTSSALNPFARYKAKYFDGPAGSGAPILHAFAALFLVGYTIDYHMHLKHHKSAHH